MARRHRQRAARTAQRTAHVGPAPAVRHPGGMVADHSEQLAAERARLVTQIASLQATFDDIVAATEDVSTDDEHDPEGHTIAWERQQTAALLDAARTQLAEVDVAIRRIEGGDYGRCESCGRPIGDERLTALPTTRTCVACAT